MNKGVQLAIALVVLVLAGFYGVNKWKQLHPPITGPTGPPPEMMGGPGPGGPPPAQPAK